MLVYIDDVCSDLSAIHGIRDASRLDAATFFKLAWRLDSYQGAVGARAASQRHRNGHGAAQGTPMARGGAGDVQARFRAAQSMPVASAADLRAITASASLPGQPAGTVTEV